jgi:hypothetical protein
MEGSPNLAEDPPMTKTAVIFDHRGMIAFGPDIPPDQLDALRQLGGRVVEDVTLDDPNENYRWPEGTEAPQLTLAVCRTDPTHYRIFKHPHQVNDDFEPTGTQHAIFGRPSDWRAFAEGLATMDRIASYTDETDTDEAWAEFDRLMSGRAG